MAESNVFIKQIMVGPMMNYAYLVGDKSTKEAAIVDPGWEASRLIAEAKKEGFEIKQIWATHTHYDHANDIPTLMKLLNLELYVHFKEAKVFDGMANVKKVDDGECFKLGNIEVKVVYTPGHTPGSICYMVGNALFTGDTLFVDSIGRTDLEGGDSEDMFKSLQKIKKLSPGMIVYPGHHYGANASASLSDQLKTNPYLKSNSISDFFRMA